MSTETNDGGPAFPTPRYERGDMYSLGMTMRDYFAAKAMQALIGRVPYPTAIDGRNVSAVAYILADAMLKARDA